MIGLDTNVLARYFVEEAVADSATAAQRQAARQLIESGQELFLPKTVALELEWVLRGYYGFAVEAVLQVVRAAPESHLSQRRRPAGSGAGAGWVAVRPRFRRRSASRQLPRLRGDRLLR